MQKDIIVYIFITLGLISAACGVLGLFRFKIFYMRILVSSNVDVLGMLLMLTGALIASPSFAIAFKIALIIILSLITNPLSSHATALSAYASGYRMQK